MASYSNDRTGKYKKNKEVDAYNYANKPQNSRNFPGTGSTFKTNSQSRGAKERTEDETLEEALIASVSMTKQRQKSKTANATGDEDGSRTRGEIRSKRGSDRRAADTFSEPSMTDEASKLTQTQPNFLKQLKKNTHIHQAINYAYKLDTRNSISIESDQEGMLVGSGGLRNGSQLPFLISKTSNFF